MNKEKQSNKPLIISIISIVACIVLLIGATMAWFTDTETNTGNKIQAGTLDIDVVWYNLDSTSETEGTYNIEGTYYTFNSQKNDFDGGTSMIYEENWWSSDVSAKLIEVTNSGSLDVQLTLDAVVLEEGLEDALWYDFVKVDSTDVIGDLTERPMNELEKFISQFTFTVEAEDTLSFVLLYGLDDSAGDSYQDKTYEADIILIATQVGATDEVVKAYTVADINEAEADQTVILMKDITDTTTGVNLERNVNFDLNGYTLEVPSFTMESDAYCTVDIANGTIKTTTMSVLIPNGTVNLDDMIGTIAEDGTVTINASDSTLNLMGTTKFTVPVTIMDDTRVVVDTISSITMQADADADNIIVVDTVTGEEIELTEEMTLAAPTYVYSEDEFLSAIDSGAGNIIMVGGETDWTDYLYMDIGTTVSIPSGTTIVIPSGTYVEFYSYSTATFTVEDGATIIIEEDAFFLLTLGVAFVNNGDVENSGLIEYSGHWYYGYPTIQNNSDFVNDGEIIVNAGYTGTKNFAGTTAITGDGKVTLDITTLSSTTFCQNSVLSDLAGMVDQPVHISSSGSTTTFNLNTSTNSYTPSEMTIPEGITVIVDEGTTLNLILKPDYSSSNNITINVCGDLEVYGNIATSEVDISSNMTSSSTPIVVNVADTGSLVQGASSTGLEDATIGVSVDNITDLTTYLNNDINETIIVTESMTISSDLTIKSGDTVVVGIGVPDASVTGQAVTLTINAELTIKGSLVGTSESINNSNNNPQLVIGSGGSIVKSDMTDNLFGYTKTETYPALSYFYTDDDQLISGLTFMWDNIYEGNDSSATSITALFWVAKNSAPTT